MIVLTGTLWPEKLDARTGVEAYEIYGLGGADVIYGSSFGDVIVGGSGMDQMFGGGGDDVFVSEGDDTAGDTVKGDEGFDTILGRAVDDVLLFVSIVSVERIDGGGGYDILRGVAGNYWNFSQTELIGIAEIDLGDGNDSLTGSSGADRVRGGAGNDTLEGGGGTDTAVYEGNYAAYTLTSLSGGQLRVSTAGVDGTDTIRGFELLEFADGVYTTADGVFTPNGDPTNTPPQAFGDSYGGVEDQTLTVLAGSGVLSNDEDVDGDGLTVSSYETTSAGGGTVTMSADGSFSYVPLADFSGTDSFGYTIADGRGGSSTATVTVEVSGVDDAPRVVNDSYGATQDTALVVGVATGVLSNDSDPEGAVLTVSGYEATSAQGGTVTMSADGSFSYTPPTGYTGPDSFGYTATDGTTPVSASVALTVSPPGTGLPLLEGTNGAERLDVRTATEGYEIHGLGGADVIYGSSFGDVIVGGSGMDQMFGGGGDDVFVSEGDDTAGDTVKGDEGFDTILGRAVDDVLLFVSIVSVERIDGGGGYDILRGVAGNYWNFSQTELIGIAEIDLGDGNDSLTGSSGADRVRGGAGNDTLEGGGGTDTAVYEGNYAAYTLTSLSGGQLRVSTAGVDGTDTIRGFELLEFADGVYTTADGVFTPNGDPTNTPPQAFGDSYGGVEDQTLTVLAGSGVLSNDEDVDGDGLTVSSYETTSAGGGTVTMSADGSFSYVPLADFSGTDSFGYTIADGRGGSSTATVTVEVSGVDDAPRVVNDSYGATQDTALVVGVATGVLSNDSDPEGAVLTVSGYEATSAQGGTVTMSADGSFSYTPPTGYTGPDSFGYTATDGTTPVSASVALTVSPPGTGLPLLEGTNGAERLDVRTATEGYEIHGLGGADVIYGSSFGDVIVGGSGMDQMFGGGGDDVFVSEGDDTAGDTVKGDEGFDTILGRAVDDVLLFVSIVSVERIDGGGGYDILRGVAGNYWNFSQTELIGIAEIDLGDGNDSLTGSSGADRVRGGAGNDTLEGGGGTDTAVYEGNYAAYTLTSLSGGQLRVSTAGVDGTDTIRGFELLEFADGVYTTADGVFTPNGDPTNTPPQAFGDSYGGWRTRR